MEPEGERLIEIAKDFATFIHQTNKIKKVRPLTKEEVFNHDAATPINLRSGAGPTLKYLSRNINNKGDFLKRSLDGVVSWKDNVEGDTAKYFFERSWEKMEKCEKEDFLSVIKRKKELLPMEKTWKPRPYFEYDTINVLLEKRFLEPIQRTLSYVQFNTGIILTADYRRDGHKMMEHLSQGGLNTEGLSLDISAFDNKISRTHIRASNAFYRRYGRLMGYSPDELNQMDCVLVGRESPLYILEDTLYQIDGTMGSGRYATNMTDSIMLIISFIYAYEKLTNNKIKISDFFSKFSVLACGDDLTFSMRDGEKLPVEKLIETFKNEMNWDVTDGIDKIGGTPRIRKLMDLMFCSRNFYALNSGVVTMALKDDSLAKILNWTKHGDWAIVALEHSAVARELVCRGRGPYESFVANYETFWNQSQLLDSIPKLDSFERANSELYNDILQMSSSPVVRRRDLVDKQKIQKSFAEVAKLNIKSVLQEIKEEFTVYPDMISWNQTEKAALRTACRLAGPEQKLQENPVVQAFHNLEPRVQFKVSTFYIRSPDTGERKEVRFHSPDSLECLWYTFPGRGEMESGLSGMKQQNEDKTWLERYATIWGDCGIEQPPRTWMKENYSNPFHETGSERLSVLFDLLMWNPNLIWYLQNGWTIQARLKGKKISLQDMLTPPSGILPMTKQEICRYQESLRDLYPQIEDPDYSLLTESPMVDSQMRHTSRGIAASVENLEGIELTSNEVVIGGNSGAPAPQGQVPAMVVSGAAPTTSEAMPEMRNIGSDVINGIELPQGFHIEDVPRGQFITDLKTAAYENIAKEMRVFSVNQAENSVLLSLDINPWNGEILNKFAYEWAQKHTAQAGGLCNVKLSIPPTPNARGEIAVTMIPSAVGQIDVAQALDRSQLTLYETQIINIATGASISYSLIPGLPATGPHRRWINRDEDLFYGQLIVWTYTNCVSTFGVEFNFPIAIESRLRPDCLFFNPDITVPGVNISEPDNSTIPDLPLAGMLGFNIDGSQTASFRYDNFVVPLIGPEFDSVANTGISETFQVSDPDFPTIQYDTANVLGFRVFTGAAPNQFATTADDDTPPYLTEPGTSGIVSILTQPFMDVTVPGRNTYNSSDDGVRAIDFYNVAGITSDATPNAPFPPPDGNLHWAETWPSPVTAGEIRILPWRGSDQLGRIVQPYYAFNPDCIMPGSTLSTVGNPDATVPIDRFAGLQSIENGFGKLEAFTLPVCQTSTGGVGTVSGTKAITGFTTGDLILPVASDFSGPGMALTQSWYDLHYRLAATFGDQRIVWSLVLESGEPLMDVLWTKTNAFTVNSSLNYHSLATIDMSTIRTLRKFVQSNTPILSPVNETLGWVSRTVLGAFPVERTLKDGKIRAVLELVEGKKMGRRRNKDLIVKEPRSKKIEEIELTGIAAAAGAIGGTIFGAAGGIGQAAVAGKFQERIQKLIGEQGMEQLKLGGEISSQLLQKAHNLELQGNATMMGISNRSLNGLNSSVMGHNSRDRPTGGPITLDKPEASPTTTL